MDLLKGLKDCFIGKRIAIVVNFNDDGITITFLKPTEFIYETVLLTGISVNYSADQPPKIEIETERLANGV